MPGIPAAARIVCCFRPPDAVGSPDHGGTPAGTAAPAHGLCPDSIGHATQAARAMAARVRNRLVQRSTGSAMQAAELGALQGQHQPGPGGVSRVPSPDPRSSPRHSLEGTPRQESYGRSSLGMHGATAEEHPEAPPRPQSAPTIHDLLDFAQLARDEPGAEVLGIERKGSDGATRTDFLLDKLLRENLSDPYGSSIAEEVRTGNFGAERQLEILAQIDEHYSPQAQSRAARLIAEARQHLGNDPSHFTDGNAFIALLEDIGKDLLDNGRRLARSGLVAALQNILRDYGVPPDSDLHGAIRKEIEALSDEPTAALRGSRFCTLVQDTATNLRTFPWPHLPVASSAPREARRTPTECMMHWIATLHHMKGNAGPDTELAGRCDTLLKDARSRWLSHRLTFGETRTFFASRQAELASSLPSLAAAAGRLLSQMPGSPDENRDKVSHWVFELEEAAGKAPAGGPVHTLCSQLAVDARACLEKNTGASHDSVATLLEGARKRLLDNALNGLRVSAPERLVKRAPDQLLDSVRERLRRLDRDEKRQPGERFLELSDLAGRLAESVHGGEQDKLTLDKDKLFFKTRLHDNVYGRVFSSALMKSLVDEPTAGIRKAAAGLAKWLAPYLLYDPEDKFGAKILKAAHRTINEKPRPWMSAVPALAAFGKQNHRDVPGLIQSMKSLLYAEKTTGADCIAIIYLLATRFADPLDDPRPDWRDRAEQTYNSLIRPERERLDNLTDVPKAMREKALELRLRGRITRDQRLKIYQQADEAGKLMKASAQKVRQGGITLPHQPPVIEEDWMIPASRPSMQYKPSFEVPTQAEGAASSAAPAAPRTFKETTRRFLAHGIPYASDISGVTNLFLHALDDANKQDCAIDPTNALILAAMYLNYDGGHSLHEVLWVANALDGKEENQISMGLELGRSESGDPEEFVADYNWLYNAEDLGPHIDEAFEATIAYLQKYSYYWNEEHPAEAIGTKGKGKQVADV